MAAKKKTTKNTVNVEDQQLPSYMTEEKLGGHSFKSLNDRKIDGAPMLRLDYIPLKRSRLGDERAIETIVTPEMLYVMQLLAEKSSQGNESLRIRFVEHALPLNNTSFRPNGDKVSTSGEQLEQLLRAFKAGEPELLEHIKRVNQFNIDQKYQDQDLEDAMDEPGDQAEPGAARRTARKAAKKR